MKMTAITFTLIILTSVLASAWDIDFSRRQKKTEGQPQTTEENQAAPSNPVPNDPQTSAQQSEAQQVTVPTEAVQDPLVITQPAESVDDVKPTPGHRLDSFVKRTITSSVYDRQEFVILNTTSGFVPSNIRLRKGLHYVVHIVNVNEERKNVSFMLDAFRQHHATYYGKIKTFNLDPDREGIFEYQCPETDFRGKLVIFGNSPTTTPERVISSEK